jgi:hypothetical protein
MHMELDEWERDDRARGRGATWRLGWDVAPANGGLADSPGGWGSGGGLGAVVGEEEVRAWTRGEREGLAWCKT